MRAILWSTLLLLFGTPLVGFAQTEPESAPAEDQAQTEKLLKEFGEGYEVRQTKHWTIIQKAGVDFVEQVEKTLERTHDVFFEQFKKLGMNPKPIRKKLICILIGDHEEFVEYVKDLRGKEPSGGGFYSSKTNRIIFFDNRTKKDRRGPEERAEKNNFGKTAHEAAHQLAFNTGVQKRGAGYPAWVGEGLASNFEPKSPEAKFGMFDAPPSQRTRALPKMERRVGLFPLEELVSMTRPKEKKKIGVMYAQGSAFFRFLANERPEELVVYLKAMAARRRGKPKQEEWAKIFEDSFGPAKDLEESWKAFLKMLR